MIKLKEMLERTWWTGVTIAACGILIFWGCGISGKINAAGISLAVAGISAGVAVISYALLNLREKNDF